MSQIPSGISGEAESGTVSVTKKGCKSVCKADGGFPSNIRLHIFDDSHIRQSGTPRDYKTRGVA
ncbi:hypothetical protein C8R31_11016 [Nitrosospira sp. Nsp2]|nr:hypothetical protein C8R31_11016 [Nitrosospira sp. Nsp2]